MASINRKRTYAICKKSTQDGLYSEPYMIVSNDISAAQTYVATKLGSELKRIYGDAKFRTLLFRINTVNASTIDMYYNHFSPELNKDVPVGDVYRVFIKDID